MKKLFTLITIIIILACGLAKAQEQNLDIISFEKLLKNSSKEIKTTILSSFDNEYQIDSVDNTYLYYQTILNHPNVLVDLTIKENNGWNQISNIGFLNNLTHLTLDGVSLFIIHDCQNLQSITLKNGARIEEIHNCPNLTSYNGTIKEIYNCPKITSIELINDDDLYYYETKLIVDFDSLETIIIPEGILDINFKNCPKLKTVNLPKSIQKINFYGCSALEEIVVPENVTAINALCFAYCTNLKKITFLNPNVQISNSAFFACDNLLSKNNPNTVEIMGKKYPSFASNANEITINANDIYDFLVDVENNIYGKENFGYIKNDLSLKNAKKLTIIAQEDEDFAYKNNDENDIRTQHIIKNCEFLETLQLVGGKHWGAIADLPNLKNLILDNNIEYISHIYNCPKLEKITLPNSLKTLPRFDYCSALKEIKIPNEIKIIPSNSFNFCTSLENIIFNNNIKTIENQAFLGCRNLKRINLPNSLDTIKEFAFAGCKSLKEINLNDNIVVGRGSFWGCENLKNNSQEDKIIVCGREFDYLGNNVGSDINNDVCLFNAMESFYGEKFNFDNEYPNLKRVKLQKVSEENPDYSLDFMMGENMNLGVFNAPNLEFAEININQQFPFVINFAFSSKLKTIVLHGGIFLFDAPKYTPLIIENQKGEVRTIYIVYCDFPGISSKNEITIYVEDKYMEFYQKQADLYNVLFAGTSTLDNNNKEYIRQKISILPIEDYIQTIENLEIPFGVTRIDEKEFRNYTSLKNITLPSSLKEIGEYAFSNCTSLEEIIIPNSVEKISNFAFSGCKNLKKIHFSPNTVVEEGVFWECSGLKNNSNNKTIIVNDTEYDYSTDEVECLSTEIGVNYKYAKSLNITNTITYNKDGNNYPLNLFNRAELESLKIKLNGQEANSVYINMCPSLHTIEAELEPGNKAEINCSESPNIQTLIFRGENQIHLAIEGYQEFIKIKDLNGKKIKKKYEHESYCYFPSQNDIKLYVENQCIEWYLSQAEIHNRLFAGKEYRNQKCGKIEVFSIDDLK